MTGAEIGILAAALGISTVLARVVEMLVRRKLAKDAPAAEAYNGTPARLERTAQHLDDVVDKLAIVADRLDRQTR